MREGVTVATSGRLGFGKGPHGAMKTGLWASADYLGPQSHPNPSWRLGFWPGKASCLCWWPEHSHSQDCSRESRVRALTCLHRGLRMPTRFACLACRCVRLAQPRFYVPGACAVQRCMRALGRMNTVLTCPPVPGVLLGGWGERATAVCACLAMPKYV